jgi:hypothetical protein
MMNRSAKIALMALVLALTLPSLVLAQATRTWVSGVGDDANPCSRTAPCKTFAGAISKTAASGEICVLDPGGFGALTITKAITINSDSIMAGVLVSGTNGINVQAGTSDVVILRGLTIDGIGSGVTGINYLSGKALVVENTTITGFTQIGIDMFAVSGDLIVKHTSITNALAGVRVASTGARATLTDVSIQNTFNGVDTFAGATTVRDSVIAHNGWFGLIAEGGVLNAENVIISGNNVGAQAQTGATLRISNSSIFDNFTGLGCGGGVIASAGNNRNAGNSGGSPSCSPTQAIVIQ